MSDASLTSPALSNKPLPEPHGLNVPAGFCAVLFPGLGHLYRGEPKRAIFAAIGVMGMFLGGILIGGIDVIDSKEDKWWFYGQAFVGPVAFGADWYHQTQLKAHPIPGVPPDAGAEGSFTTSDLQLLTEHAPRSVFPGEKRVMAEVEVIEGPGGRPAMRTLAVAVPAGEGEGPPNRKSLAKVNEIGTLYALCAGMLNLIVILDALFPTIRPSRGKAGQEKTGGGDA